MAKISPTLLAIGLACFASELGFGAQAETAPFDVTLKLDMGGDSAGVMKDVVVKIHPDWAPLGAAQFKMLVEKGWYNDAAFFRVVQGFVAQVGLPAEPQDKLDTIKDDPVKKSNVRGTLVFATAGKDTRDSQLFINFGDNSGLDSQGFSPFGEVTGDGMSVVDEINSEYGESPDQGAITAQGNAYLDPKFPGLTKIKTTTLTATV